MQGGSGYETKLKIRFPYKSHNLCWLRVASFSNFQAFTTFQFLIAYNVRNRVWGAGKTGRSYCIIDVNVYFDPGTRLGWELHFLSLIPRLWYSSLGMRLVPPENDGLATAPL